MIDCYLYIQYGAMECLAMKIYAFDPDYAVDAFRREYRP
jgi:hypothetical protein